MKFIGNRHLIDSVDIFSPINTQQNFSNVDGKTFDDVAKQITDVEVLVHSGLLPEFVNVSDRLNYNMHEPHIPLILLYLHKILL